MIRPCTFAALFALALGASDVCAQVPEAAPAQVPEAAPARILLAARDPLDEHAMLALRTELALRGFALEVVATALAEEAGARQALVTQRAALALVWMEREPMRASVLTRGGASRTTALPATAEARVLAILVVSLVEEALDPNEPTEQSEDQAAGAPTSPSEPDAAPREREADEALRLGAPNAPPEYLDGAGDALPVDEADAPRPANDGEAHFFAIVDAAVGAMWHRVAAPSSNIAHLTQRVGAGVRVDSFRGELTLGGGGDIGMDGSYPSSGLFETHAFIGCVLRVDDLAFDLGGTLDFLLHGLIDASSFPTGELLAAFRLGSAVGISLPDHLSRFPFRARAELGAYLRPSPERVVPYTIVALGIGFW